MAITTVADLNTALPGQTIGWSKTGITTTTSTFASGWTLAGVPTAGTAPGAAAIPTKATTGAIPFTNPASGNTYLGYARTMLSITAMGISLYDRLMHSSGLDATLTTAQNVNSPALTRPSATGDDVEMYLEFYTAPGATASTATVTYTNSSGTTSRTGTATISAGGVASYVGQMIPVTLQAGDTGVNSVQTVQLSGTTAGAGNFGVTLARRIAPLTHFLRNYYEPTMARDWMSLGFPRIYDDACLALMATYTAGQFGTAQGQLVLVQG